MIRWLLSITVLLLAIYTACAQAPSIANELRPASIPLTFPMPTPQTVTTCCQFDPLADRNGCTLVGNDYLDGPRNHLGWFGSVDLDILASHVHNELTAPVAVGPRIDQVSLPSANLHWTASPRFELGYRCGEGFGEFLLSYRFLSTSGSATTSGFDLAGNPGALHSRLAFNVIDLDYANQEVSLRPWFDMKWRFGVRLANLYFDSEATSTLLHQHETNYFFGAGPHAALELWHPVAKSRFGLFGKLDAASVMGKVQQGFEETVPGPVSGFTRQSQFMPSFMLNVQAGVGWTPSDNWRISAGYTYEHWWDATFAGASRGDVWTQGVFLRCEWKF
jgi:hypothetical protein